MRPSTDIYATLEHCLAGLEQRLNAPTLSADAIHRCRVSVKKLRAWLRVIQPSQECAKWKTADKALRHIARSLSGQRDAHVLRGTLLWLGKHSRDATVKANCRKLHKLFARTKTVVRVRPTLSDDSKQLCLSGTRLLAQVDVREGLRHSYAKARRLSRKVLVQPKCPETLHRLRRWVKYLHYQHKLLFLTSELTWLPPATLDKLGATLGRLHDLHELLRTLKRVLTKQQQDTATQDALATTIDLAAAAIRQLTQEIIATIPLLFRLKPKQYRARLTRW
jgi:CHAD domain-containing protein